MMKVISITHLNSNKIWVDIVPNLRARTIADIKHPIIPPTGIMYCDGGAHYRLVEREMHQVKHAIRQYTRIVDLADGMRRIASTNHTESGWSMFKRTYHGVNHKISPKHLNRYSRTFAGRWNIHNLDTEDQMRFVFRQMQGRKLSYEELIRDIGLPSGSRAGGAYFPREGNNGELDDYIA